MLKQAEWIDDRYYTDEGRRRGSDVHDLTADYDFGILDVAHFESEYRGYVLGYVSAVRILRPEWMEIEQTAVHHGHKFGGKPDRSGIFEAMISVVEVKSGAFEKSHPIQTALQAILRADRFNLAPRSMGRFAIYINGRGRFAVDEHKDQRDFDEAYRVIDRCCR